MKLLRDVNWPWARVREEGLSLFASSRSRLRYYSYSLFMDMNLMAPNLSTIAEEFRMNDDERDVKPGGMIVFGFLLVGVPVSFLLGWLADSISRSPLFAVTAVFVGEIGCLLMQCICTIIC